MDEENRYELVCKSEFHSINKKLDTITSKLYVDNGGESQQSKINRHDIWIRRATGIGLAVAIAVFGLCIDAVQEIIKGIIN